MNSEIVSKLLFFLLLFLRLEAESFPCEEIPPHYALHENDKLQFGRLWGQIRRLEEKELLHPMILERRKEISQIKGHWKEKITHLEPLELVKKLDHQMETGTLTGCTTGCGSAYFLVSPSGDPLYVIKPFDEDILCLNNRKHFASPYNNLAYRVRDDIPLYRSTQAEGLAYRLAHLLELGHLTPETHLAILTHDAFFDITDHLSTDDPLLAQLGKPDREKLCSVQTFHEGARNLYNLVEEWLEKELAEEEILASIDKVHFDELVFLIWLFYDTDAHAGNLYAYQGSDGRYRLLKIDNGLTFPEKNTHLVNALYFFPQAKERLSPSIREKIASLPMEKIKELFTLFELDAAYPAFVERVDLLKQLTQTPAITIREIDIRLHTLVP